MTGRPISWRSKKKTVVATSYCEAEYVDSYFACQEAVWIQKLLADIRNSPQPPTIKLLIDNQGAIETGKNQSINQRNKQVDIKYNFVREIVRKGNFILAYCPTVEMAADPIKNPWIL